MENTHLDKSGGNTLLGDAAGNQLTQICKVHCLVDVYRLLHPNERKYSWSAPAKGILCRLDRFYVSKALLGSIRTANVQAFNINSDHACVDITMDTCTSSNVVGGVWKCNNAVLLDQYFKDDFQRLWTDLNSTPVKSSDWWESCKDHFRDLIMAHSQRLSMARNYEIDHLRQRIENFKTHYDSSNISQQEHLINLQTQLDALSSRKLEGAKIRSKVKYLELNEKPTSYFLRKERQNANAKVISSISTPHGIVTSQEDITAACLQYYSDLYARQPVNNNCSRYFLEEKTLPKLHAYDSLSLEGPITKAECILALKSMSNNKSPGRDGLTKEFYESTFGLIGDSFVSMVNGCFDNGALSGSQRTGLITLICKDKDAAADLSNWRPITLLNYDYKIISKVIYMRLQNVISSIINIDQTCGIRGRSILDNLHLMRNIIDYANDKNIKAAVLSLDQSKAFDRVSHEYLFATLRAFGFGPTFIQWVQLLYTNIQSSLLINGQVSQTFQISRSVRQGCSLSPLLYILCIEPFAHRIRIDKNISGLKLPGTIEEARISQYADDTDIVVCNKSSIARVFSILEMFCHASGSKLNKVKTWGIWLGTWRNCLDRPGGINWTNTSHKFCGIVLGNSNVLLDNWKARRDKMTAAMNMHSARSLSLRGKSILIQSVICTKLWFIGAIIPLPRGIAKGLQSSIFNFVWHNKPESVRRTVMYADYADGGMKIINIAEKLRAFHAKHIYQLIKGHKAKWTYFAIYWLGYKLRKFVPAFASNLIPHSFYMPIFYSESLSSFEDVIRAIPDLLRRNDIKVKDFYKVLINDMLTQPLVVAKHHTIAFHNVWPNIHTTFVDSNARDLAWRIAHECLPTNDLLYRHGVRRHYYCALCGAERETLVHLFIKCPVVSPLWAFILALTSDITASRVSIWKTTVLFNIMRDEYPKNAKQVFLYMLNKMKHCIWLKRNLSQFEGAHISTNAIKFLFIRELNLRLSADRHRLTEIQYTSFWGDTMSVVV